MRVDAVLDTEELVIKPAAPCVMATGIYAGQTLPDSGRPMLLLDCAGIAADAGLVFERELIEVEEETAAASGVQALLFRDLDDQVRAIPLAVIDRVEQTDTGAIRHTGGRLRLTIDGLILPLAALGEIGSRTRIDVLRLKDGAREVGYAIAEALDIIELTSEIAPAPAGGPIAGVVLHDDEQVEVLDPYWLFSDNLEGAAGADSPLCLIDSGDPWLATFVKPMLERAGYRVASVPAPGEVAVAVLTADPAVDDAAAITLRAQPSGGVEGSIYRYDREGILAAVERRVMQAGGLR
jgi:two-component system chemotaxis sensor kinase CheA